MQLKYFKLIYLKLKIHIMSIIGGNYSYDRYDTKWNRIKKFAIYFNNDADFVETGTYYGLTVDFCKKYFLKFDEWFFVKQHDNYQEVSLQI